MKKSIANGLSAALLAGLLVGLDGGCVTEERDLGSEGRRQLRPVDDSPPPLVVQEERLKEAVEDASDEPAEQARVWFALADFYENSLRLPDAALAYERMNAAIQQLPNGARYTAGHYHLGRIYARMKQYPAAVEHLRQVLALEPKDRQVAGLYDHFRESHYLLGIVYYNTHQWETAQEHLTAFKDLGGEAERVDSLLMNISYEMKGK